MDDVYQVIFKLLGEERKKRGAPAQMKGRILSRLIKAIDAVLEYNEPKKPSKP
jgi:hypothetical protein